MAKGVWVGGLLLAAGVATPWGVGALTEYQWQQMTREMNDAQSYFEVDTRSYRRHFFSAEIEGVISVQDPNSGDTHRIPYHGDVSHGVLGSQVEFQRGVDSADSADSADLMAEWFPEQQPNLIITLRAWGTAEIELNVPAISVTTEETGESLDSAEGYGWAKVSGLGDDVELELSWPGLTARGPETRLAFTDLQVSHTMSRLQGDVWVGNGRIKLASLEAAREGQPELVLDGFSVDSSTHAEDSERRFSSKVNLNINRIEYDDGSSGPYVAEFVLNRMEVEAWNRLTSAVAGLQALAMPQVNGESQQALIERQMDLMLEVSNAAKALAGAGMSLGFPELRFDTAQGRVAGEFMLQHPELSAEEQARLSLVMQRLTGDFKLSVPVALAEATPALMTELEPLIEQGFLVREGDQYKLDARLKDLEVDVNGTKIPLPPMI